MINNYFKKEEFELIKIEVFFSLILFFIFFITQLNFNLIKTADSIQFFFLFLNYFFFTYLQNKYENILLRLLNLFILIFFLFRISFISIDIIRTYSLFFSDYMPISEKEIIKYYSIDKIDKYLIFLNINYLFLGTLLTLIRPKSFNLSLEFIKPSQINLILLIIIVQIFLIFLYYNIFPLDLNPSKHIAVLKIFFHLFNLDKIYILLALMILLMNKFDYKKKLKISIILTTILTLSFATIFFFSKSSLLEITLYITIIYFLIDKKFIIKIKHIKYIFFYIVLFIFLFSVAKIFRVFFYADNITSYTFFSHLNVMHKFIFVILERIGFIDYYLFIVSNESILKELFVFENYYKIILDKLTPFFDLFNSTLLSRQVYSSFYPGSSGVTQSYQITFFGEMYLLFGYFSVIFYFFFIISLKFCIDYLNNLKISKNIKILLIFFILKSYFFYLIGYGLDTFIINMIYDCTFIFLVFIGLLIFKKSKIKYGK